MSERKRRGWPIAVVNPVTSSMGLAGLMLAVAVMAASASTAPASLTEWQPIRRQLSGTGMWAAYPDIGMGDAGLVSVVWTEGDGSAVEKHRGPLKLGWISDTSPEWTVQTVTSDSSDVIDAAIATRGAAAHLVWSQEGVYIYYTMCALPDDACGSVPEKIAEVGSSESATASQVDIALDDAGGRHVVWVQDNKDQAGNVREVCYRYRGNGGEWGATQVLSGSLFSEGPAVAWAGGSVHVAWTETELEGDDTLIKYCRRTVGDTSWVDCEEFANWGIGDYLARNLSIAAEGSDVYVVWDLVQAGDTAYAIGYVHSGNGGQSWRSPRTFPNGSKSGDEETEFFESVEAAEYVRYLRPHVTLASSGTVKVPVLAWHANRGPDAPPELSRVTRQDKSYKALWTYALQPGSDNQGNVRWATDYITLSTDLAGEVDTSVNSAGAVLCVEGDLNAVLDSGWEGEGRLHAAYHEVGTNEWRVFYNGGEAIDFLSTVYLPLILSNFSSGG